MPTGNRPVDASRQAHTPLSLAGEAAVALGMRASLALLLFLSGAAALVYQILWIKQLSLVVGIDIYAVTGCVSAFFAGLALGGFALGRWADRVRQPLRLYAMLEIGVALLGIATTLGLAHVAEPFARLEAHSGLLAWALVLVLVGLAPFLMGGTLPVVVRALRLQAGQVGAGGGRLYAANTAGAIAGALAASFLLLPAFGVQGAAYVAAAANLAAGAAALALVRFAPPAMRVPASVRPANEARLAVILYALAGGIALGYEVVWSQTIVQFASTRSFAFSVVLATYLAGLMAGAALYARWADRVRDPWSAFGLLIAAAGLVALVEIAVLGRWVIVLQTAVEAAMLDWTGSIFAGMCGRFAVAAACIVFVPTLFLGAAFPAALRLAVDPRHIGRDVGAVVAFNTIGGIGGTILTGFVLVPALGLVHALAALAIAATALGVVAVMRSRAAPKRADWAAVGLAAAAVLAACVTPSGRLADLLAGSRGGRLVSYEESRGATVAVIEQSLGRTRFRRLYIQGVSNSGDAMPSLRYMRLQALLPLILHGGEPRSVLVIGLGTGITAGALLQFPGLERRVVAELLPAVVRAAPNFRGNFAAASDPRLDIRLRDGRRELLPHADLYDLITLEPPPPSAAGIVNLYSSDFYRLAAARLRHGGLVAQWLPLATQNDEDSRSLVRSFLDVFPHASLWTTEFHEMLLVGSAEPIELDVPRITQRFGQPDIAAALRDVGVASPAALLATWVMDRGGLEQYAGDAPAVTDDRPRIEHAHWVRRRELARVLPRLLELGTSPPLRGAENAFVTDLARERERLLAFYGAGLHAYQGERALWASQIGRVMKEDGLNPYYRWFALGEGN